VSSILEFEHVDDGVYRVAWEPEEGRLLISDVQASWRRVSFARSEVEAEDITPRELAQPRVPSDLLEMICQAEEQRHGR